MWHLSCLTANTNGQENPVARSRFKIPHVFVLLTLVIAVCSAATWIIPSGRYDRETRVMDGRERTLLVPGTFQHLDKNYSLKGIILKDEVEGKASPIGLQSFLSAVPRGMESAADIIFFIFMIGGTFGVLQRTGVITASLNRLLGKMNRLRIDAEVFRDSVLRMSGQLDLTMGGPGVEQFVGISGKLATTLDYNAYDWNQPSAKRRSIYRLVWRTIPDPFMEALDFPDLGILAPKRGQSLSALQSLAIFNNNFMLHGSEWIVVGLETQLGLDLVEQHLAGAPNHIPRVAAPPFPHSPV